MKCEKKKKSLEYAQAQLEAIICTTFFLAMLGMVLHSIGTAKEATEVAEEALLARSNTILCCTAVDSIYSNSSEGISEAKMKCTANGNKMQSDSVEKTMEANCIAPNNRTMQSGRRTEIEVTLNEHYK